MSTDSPDPSHGHSPAAWTTVIIIMAAFFIGTIFFFLELPWVVVGCAILAVIGLIVGWVMRRMGYGVHGPRYEPKAQ